MKSIMKTIQKYLSTFTATLIIIALSMAFTGRAQAQQSFILNLQGQTMSFTNAQRTILVNTGNNGTNVGSIHKYNNVITKDGIVVYAKMKVAARVNATITNWDDDVETGDPMRFQPRIGSSNTNGGYVVYELEFFNTANDLPVYVYNYNLTGIDIDGSSSSNREYVEVGGYTSYTVNNPTGLTISTNNSTGRTRFLGISTSLPGVTFDNSAAFIANFMNPNNKISFALGQTRSNTERMYSVQLGVAGGVFTTPTTTNNPLPIAVDDVGTPVSYITGGVAVTNVLSNDLYNGQPLNPNNFYLTLVNSPHPGITLNTSNGQVSVAPGTPAGNYTLNYQICNKNASSDCDVADVFVKVLGADLQISKTANVSQITAGQNIQYTLTVTNNGPTEAYDVIVNDQLPSGLTVVSAVPSTGTWAAPNWNLGTLNSQASATLTITASIANSFSGNLVNSATVSSTTPDPNSTNNNSSVTVSVTAATQPPIANNDQANTSVNTPVDIYVLENDEQGSSALNPASITFTGTLPNPSTQGVFTVNPSTGVVTFTPANNFTGTVTLNYQVCNLDNLCAQAAITVNVIPGASIFYPAASMGTLAFEDLWPSKGDYDFNDMVIDYRFETIINYNNYIESITATFKIRAFGASFRNGFGFQIPGAVNPAHLTVSGYSLTESYINLESNGVESGQSKPTVIVFDNAFGQMQHPGQGIGVNTDPSAPYVQPKTLTVTITFKPNTYSINDVNIADFNPFLIVNGDRTREVHLPGFAPTSLASTQFFGTFDDASNPGQNKYYLTANNLPWALNIYESIDYMKEKVDILQGYLKFAQWAMSGGTAFPDWYKNLPGYRDNSNIYPIPTKK
ncbi:MAG: LruC domain-containing protein [Bacteroidales bacterium]